jgi:hypothetical protein
MGFVHDDPVRSPVLRTVLAKKSEYTADELRAILNRNADQVYRQLRIRIP